MARIEKLMFRDPSKMTILRHLNLAGPKAKSTQRLNLTLPRERLSNYSPGLKYQIDRATQSDTVQEPSKLALNGFALDL